MRQALSILLIFVMLAPSPYSGMQMQAMAATPPATQDWNQDYDIQFSAEQLDNLVAPIALYPDPLLAQVFLAATFPDQIDEAAREIRAYGSGYNVDMAPWDVSVKAVAHYPVVLSMMADKLDWTTSLGQAYVNQSADVMDAVQRLRRRARSYGNLVTTPQQQIVETDGYIYVYPARAEYIYVPVYDPSIVYVQRPWSYSSGLIWFGAGLLIGAWLNHDCDWDRHRVYYHGWGAYGGYPAPIWVTRSRPRVRINNIYVNNTYNNVVINRTVINRRVNYGSLDRYHSVHRDVDYSNVRRERRPAGQNAQPPRPVEAQRDNKVIRRNIDPNDPRINANRGRGQFPQQPQPEVRAPGTSKGPETRRGEHDQPKQQPQVNPPIPQQRGNVQVPRVEQPRQPIPQHRGNVQVPRVEPKINQPIPQQRGNVQVPRVEQPGQPVPRQRDNVRIPRVEQPGQPIPQQRGNVQVPRVEPKINQPNPQQRGNVRVPRVEQPRVSQPLPQPRQPDSVFRGNRGAIDPGAASQRGQASRAQQARPAPQVYSPPRVQGNAGQAPKGNPGGAQGGPGNRGQGRHK